jgi:hypothetical protein
MADSVAQAPGWLLHNSYAGFRSHFLTGSVDVAHPDRGLSGLAVDGRPISGQILGVADGDGITPNYPLSPDDPTANRRSWQVADCYLRGEDLVATYAPGENWPYTTQIYWRAALSDLGENGNDALSLLVLLQTHLLDSWPTMYIHSSLDAVEVVHVSLSAERSEVVPLAGGISHTLPLSTTADCVLRRLRGIPFSYAEIMQAGDVRAISVRRDEDGVCSTSWELFAEFLEKGVIRRAHLLSAIVPRANDVDAAFALCNAVTRRPLPLTT